MCYHARHAVEANRQDSCNSVCRQTDTPGHSCVYLHMWMQYLQYSEVQERIFTPVFICERGLRNGDKRDSSDLSLPRERQPECERWWAIPNFIKSTWCDSYLSAKKTQTHISSAFSQQNIESKIIRECRNPSPHKPQKHLRVTSA